jgi:hypothetical protein
MVERAVGLIVSHCSTTPLPKTPSPSLQEAAMSHTVDSIMAGNPILPMPTLPPHPDTPMSMGSDFPLASANTQAPDPGPNPSSTQCPPLFDVKVSVFGILNHFHKCWFLSQDHVTKHIMEAQKAPNG